MNNIFKSFIFESEGVKLTLNINKEFHSKCLRFIIDGNIETNNKDFNIYSSVNGSSLSFSLNYLDNSLIWISSNEWKGLRWEKYSNETK